MLDNLQHQIAQTAIFRCSPDNADTDPEVIKKMVEETAKFFGYNQDIVSIIRYVESKVNCSMELGVSVVSAEAEHDQDWIKQIKEEEKIYATSYERYLMRKNMAPSVINSISRVNDKILSLMGNPKQESVKFQRRGLVIGDVQSGKTSNYLSLLTKAADAGYKFIIVIAGIHNNLRSQTQQRVDEGFVGRVSSQKSNKEKTGVALQFDGLFPHPVSLTTVDKDFNAALAGSLATEISDFNKPLILVIKKNVSTLRSLHTWLVNFSMKGAAKVDGKINTPMLLIDDEADNASINTNNIDPEVDPTQTNLYIRTILQCFNHASYVGYTATPFANIFIDPNSYDERKEDLFPKDFIYNLDAPSNYFGARRIFLNDDYRFMHVFLDPDEVKKYIPQKHKKTLYLQAIPDSLKESICCFLLAKCIRNLRQDANQHCSMLINVSTFVDVQIQIKNKVLDFLDELGNAVLCFSAMPDALDNSYIQLLYQTFQKQYSTSKDSDDVVIQWQRILVELRAMFDDSDKAYVFKTCVVNSASQDALDYEAHLDQGLMVIAIGGFSLSRGLTIEGLTISYFYRSTQMYDTLLQMGRWFGYRPGYEDLCRIFMTENANSWYRHISMAADDVRMQIATMNQLKQTPKDFGLYVRASNTGLIITARNKMKTAEQIQISQSFSGLNKEQSSFHKDPAIHANNYKLLESFWGNLRQQYSMEQFTQGGFFKDVPVGQLIELLVKFKFGHPDYVTASQELMEASTRYLIAIQHKYPKADVLFKSVGANKYELKQFSNIQSVERNKVTTTDNINYILNNRRLGSSDDEKVGLNEDQLSRLEKDSPVEYRSLRKKPFLIIYLVNLTTLKDEENDAVPLKWDEDKKLGFPGLSLSFPLGDKDLAVEIYANRIYVDSNVEFEEEA